MLVVNVFYLNVGLIQQDVIIGFSFCDKQKNKILFNKNTFEIYDINLNKYHA